jgi:hypothetical protein
MENSYTKIPYFPLFSVFRNLINPLCVFVPLCENKIVYTYLISYAEQCSNTLLYRH